ncbi:MAG: cell division protein FtsZ [Candidatus Liptonbacteria bacterium]|nr:cell division protein FtsZ [Candidatus Liptonbacteria bacterium]
MKRAKDIVRPILTSVKVVGVGGGGGNAVSRMAKDFHRGVEFMAINTDQQDLDQCEVKRKIYIGRNLTRGMGTGMNPDLGRQAAEENRSEIAEALRGTDLVFISAGLGGGTGSGASPVIAEVAKQAGALTIAVVTRPFSFEGTQRERIAQDALVRLKEKVDALIVVPNDRIFSLISKDTPLLKAFQAIDEVLRNALVGVVELILTAGIINVDFADLKAIMQDAGSAIIGIGIASGPDRAVQAVNQALNSPLVEVSAEGAHGVLLGVAGSRDLKMAEINDAARLVAQTVDPSAKIIFGAYFDRRLKPNQVKVTLIATGFTHNGIGSPNSLFAATAYEHKSPGILSGLPSSASLAGEEEADKTKHGKEPPKPMSSSSESRLAAQASADDFDDYPLPTGQHAKDSSSVGPKKKESDIWDIPTFLRKRKK